MATTKEAPSAFLAHKRVAVAGVSRMAAQPAPTQDPLRASARAAPSLSRARLRGRLRARARRR
jgi:hypothetical protein